MPAPAPQIPNAAVVPEAPSNSPVSGVLPPTTTQPPTQKSVVVEQAPPAPRLEVVPLSPGPRYVWVPGYWSYRYGHWYWVGGTWVMRPHATAVWVGGYWARHGRSYIWISGHWR